MNTCTVDIGFGESILFEAYVARWWANKIDAMYLFASFESTFDYPDSPEVARHC